MTDALDLVRTDLAVIEARRHSMRESMPGTASIVDSMRAVFGDVKVRWAKEGDKEVGKRQPFDGIDVDQLLRYYNRKVVALKERRK